MPELDFSKIVKVFNSLIDASKAIIEDIQMIHKVQMLVVCGVFILGLGSCSNAVRVGRLQNRIKTLEHENSVLETRVYNLENRTEENKK